MLTPYLTPFSHFSYYLIMLVDSSMWSSFTLPMSKRSQNTSIEVLRELSDIVANQERVVTPDPILRRVKRRCCAASPRTSRVRRKPLAFPLHYGAYNIVVITIFSQQYTQQKCCQNVSLPKKKKKRFLFVLFAVAYATDVYKSTERAGRQGKNRSFAATSRSQDSAVHFTRRRHHHAQMRITKRNSARLQDSFYHATHFVEITHIAIISSRFPSLVKRKKKEYVYTLETAFEDYARHFFI